MKSRMAPTLSAYYGLGLCDPSDPTCAGADLPVVGSTSNFDPIPIDPSTGEPDPLLTDESGNFCLASMFVNGQCPQSVQGPVDPSLLYASPGFNIKTTPAAPLTPAQMQAQQTQAASDLLKMVPTTAAIAAQLANSGLALTAAQIAAGVQAGTVRAVPTTTCPTGYQYSTGTCVPGTGQWFSFATNTQVITWGVVVVGALIIVPMLSGGGGRRRR